MREIEILAKFYWSELGLDWIWIRSRVIAEFEFNLSKVNEFEFSFFKVNEFELKN